jgi:hypothetical protein
LVAIPVLKGIGAYTAKKAIDILADMVKRTLEARYATQEAPRKTVTIVDQYDKPLVKITTKAVATAKPKQS